MTYAINCGTWGRQLKRRQAIEPAIGHCKNDHGMARCWLRGSLGDALHAVLCAAGYNLRWLMRAVRRKGAVFAVLRVMTAVSLFLSHARSAMRRLMIGAINDNRVSFVALAA